MSSLRVMSYNVHAGIGLDDKYELERVIEVIRGSGAAVVGLQEVDVFWSSRSNHANMVEQLAQSLGMHAFYAPIYELPPHKKTQPLRQFGVALLSRYPMERTFNLSMTRLSSQDASPFPKPMPGFAKVELLIEHVAVSVYVVHLDYQLQPEVRAAQVEEILAEFRAHPDETRLLLGDFNARPEAPELAPLFQAMQDTWLNHAGDPGLTYPSDFPDRKIDYILASPNIRVNSSATIRSNASDHRAIVTDLVLPE